MMKWGMEILSPSVCSNTNWLLEESKSKSTEWTHEENKLFENALAVYDKDTTDGWQKIAAMIPGKTVMDVIKQYKELENDVSDIEAGRIPIPGYTTSRFTLDWVNNQTFSQSFDVGGKRSSSGRSSDQERKKGVPWTEDEHRLFLMGLKKYGKGDWRNISRNFVISRTPTQVASHAQKYFIRQLSGGKDKKRSSIHDITTVNFTDTRSPSPDNNGPLSLDQSTMHPRHTNLSGTTEPLFDWNQPQDGTNMVFSVAHDGNLFVPPPYQVNSYGMKMQGQNLHRSTNQGSHIRPHSTIFQMQYSQCNTHG